MSALLYLSGLFEKPEVEKLEQPTYCDKLAGKGLCITMERTPSDMASGTEMGLPRSRNSRSVAGRLSLPSSSLPCCTPAGVSQLNRAAFLLPSGAHVCNIPAKAEASLGTCRQLRRSAANRHSSHTVNSCYSYTLYVTAVLLC